ncbi:NAD(P)H-dependent FMN reductase [Flavobacterium nitrogenifigens]|uniref:NAD(P)H-dependent FMN reductase n=2 Tax=Flavobacterium TaxID=237 RepID=A0A7W7J1G2_9FLAO|nr:MULTISPECIES: NADPH-dependent FMN reductase [Flavobacterium]MBB4804133.1 NAD(P)H-dependent FMN reductase [Flavobacterium nitrogenifigens]MBB6389092.1 NAD(P)H-dependent FMN reductase [Flavobacterium notoginsengisoli]
MSSKIKILAVSGSTRKDSSNFKILKYISNQLSSEFELEIFEDLDILPHFNPDLDTDNLPKEIISLRNKIRDAQGVIICTPEYVFSLPGSLKNALEWFVSTTLFTDKTVGLITASASGEMAHEQLLLIMKTLGAELDSDTQLLIQGVRGKINPEGEIVDLETAVLLQNFINRFENHFL